MLKLSVDPNSEVVEDLQVEDDDLFSDLFGERIRSSESKTEQSVKTSVEAEFTKWSLQQHSLSEDPYMFWASATNRVSFPNLALLADKHLSTPASSVDVERAFSGARHILTDYRKSLSPKKFAMLLFLHQNIKFMGIELGD
uniref:Dimer_Tnp_hAT domain-containing protein n=1 Tax=Caenorhabditis japonica TaxID=281687 RepID=A0A8R1EV22_CAEJA